MREGGWRECSGVPWSWSENIEAMKMRAILNTLLWMFVLAMRGEGVEVPEKIRAEMSVVEGLMEKAFVYNQKAEVGEQYWQAMKNLGAFVKEDGRQDWLASLTPLERRIIDLALHHAQSPEMARTLAGWYGGYQGEVPRELRGVMTDEQWNSIKGSTFGSRIPLIERLHPEHAAQAYRQAWEGWILAPRTYRKGMLMRTAFRALSGKLIDDDTIPLVLFMAEQGIKNKNDQKTNQEMDCALETLLKIKSEASILAMLKVFDMAKLNAIAPSSSMSVEEFQFVADKDAFLDDLFVFIVSGYTLPIHPGESPFQHREGKLFMPAIESALKRKDLSAQHSALLKRTAETIRKHCRD